MEKAFENRVFHICALNLACQNPASLKRHNFQKHNFGSTTMLFVYSSFYSEQAHVQSWSRRAVCVILMI